MNKDFFNSFDKRTEAFASRAGLGPDDVRTEIVLASGRAFVIDTIVETDDGWIQLDVHEPDDESVIRSMVLPYYQIHHVLFLKRKARVGSTGFARG
jgi:hypothetical protein